MADPSLAKTHSMNWFVYMIRSSDGSLYTGVTTDVERRFREHADSPRGARFFNGRQPVEIAYTHRGVRRKQRLQA